MFRQGDVLVIPVTETPDNMVPVELDPKKGVVLAYGEVTGHAHALDPKTAELFQVDDQRFLKVGDSGAVLFHEEHSEIPLDPGLYEIRRQREYTPERNIQVAD